MTAPPGGFKHRTKEPSSRVAVIESVASRAPPRVLEAGSDGQAEPTGVQNANSPSTMVWLPVKVMTTG